MKFKSKKLESIVKEFARTLYKNMSEDDKEYIQEESFIMGADDGTFNKFLVPAVINMSDREYYLAAKKLGQEMEEYTEQEKIGLLVNMVDEALEELAGE